MKEPKGIKLIIDNEGKTTDRYSVYFDDGYVLMMSDNPQSPRGVCMSDVWGGYITTGMIIAFQDLPERVQQAIISFQAEKI